MAETILLGKVEKSGELKSDLTREEAQRIGAVVRGMFDERLEAEAKHHEEVAKGIQAEMAGMEKKLFKSEQDKRILAEAGQELAATQEKMGRARKSADDAANLKLARKIQEEKAAEEEAAPVEEK